MNAPDWGCEEAVWEESLTGDGLFIHECIDDRRVYQFKDIRTILTKDERWDDARIMRGLKNAGWKRLPNPKAKDTRWEGPMVDGKRERFSFWANRKLDTQQAVIQAQ